MIDDNYNDFHQSALIRAEGDSIRAEQLMDCSIFEYYYRVYQFKMYSDKREAAMKSNK